MEGLREKFSLQQSDIWGEDYSFTAVVLARLLQCGLARPTLERVDFGRRGGAIPPTSNRTSAETVRAQRTESGGDQAAKTAGK